MTTKRKSYMILPVMGEVVLLMIAVYNYIDSFYDLMLMKARVAYKLRNLSLRSFWRFQCYMVGRGDVTSIKNGFQTLLSAPS